VLPSLLLSTPPVETPTLGHRARDAPVQAALLRLLWPPMPGAVVIAAVRRSFPGLLRCGCRGRRRAGQLVRNTQQVVRRAPQILGQPDRVTEVPSVKGTGIQPIILVKVACGPIPQFPDCQAPSIL